jgi:hypothetical protein
MNHITKSMENATILDMIADFRCLLVENKVQSKLGCQRH